MSSWFSHHIDDDPDPHWEEDLRIWVFETHGFTSPRDPSSRERGAPASVVPLRRPGAPHLRLIPGGKEA